MLHARLIRALEPGGDRSNEASHHHNHRGTSVAGMHHLPVRSFFGKCFDSPAAVVYACYAEAVRSLFAKCFHDSAAIVYACQAAATRTHRPIQMRRQTVLLANVVLRGGDLFSQELPGREDGWR